MYSKSAIYRDPTTCGCGCGTTPLSLNGCLPACSPMPLCPPNLNLTTGLQQRYFYPSQLHCTTMAEPVSIQCSSNRKSIPLECMDLSPPTGSIVTPSSCRTTTRCVSPVPAPNPCHRSRCVSPVQSSTPPCLPKPVYYDDCRQSRLLSNLRSEFIIFL